MQNLSNLITCARLSGQWIASRFGASSLSTIDR